MNFEEIGNLMVWWTEHITKPYAMWMYVENLVGVTVAAGVGTAILLGLFWTPRKTMWSNEWDDNWGWPILILLFSTFFIPIFSVFVVAILPLGVMLGIALAVLLGVYFGLRTYRTRRKERKYEQDNL